MNYFLGIQAHCDASGIHMRQSKFILDLLHKAKMLGAKDYRSLCVSGSKLSTLDGTPLVNSFEYKQLVGCLQYCILTHLAIAYSVSQLCQHLHSPTTSHWTALKHIFPYLKGSVYQWPRGFYSFFFFLFCYEKNNFLIFLILF